MVGVIVRPSFWYRRAVILAAAAALILPMPARCASCATGASDCSHRRAADAKTTAAVRPCCERHAVVHGADAPEVIDCTRVQTRTCGCDIRPVDRTFVPTELSRTLHDILGAAPAVQPLFFDAANDINSAAAAFGDLPPPVPHRILHCSWII